MDQAEPPSRNGGLLLPGGYPPADFRRRALARGLDSAVALAPLLLVPHGHRIAGELSAAALLLCGDSLFGPGRSLGKRILGLRTIVLATRRPAGTVTCLRRNALFAFALLPALLGAAQPLLATAIALLALLSLEASVALQKLTRDLGQRRLGDLFAGTQVIDASLAIGLPAPPSKARVVATVPLASRAALDSALGPGPRARRPDPGHSEEHACVSP